MELPAGIRFGAEPLGDGTRFTVWSASADRIWVCVFDEAGREIDRVAMTRNADGIHSAMVPGTGPGTRYGLRADGPNDPAAGFWFDPAKLLVDPYAWELDRPFAYDPLLASPRAAKVDTAELMPKAIVPRAVAPLEPAPPVFKPGGLIYELSVRGFTMLHPEVPAKQRGTVAALAHPAVLAHLKAIGVSAVELMPIVAWIDERHLGPLGLTNSWGYNPVAMMALDPRLCPGGLAELRRAVAALRAAGIGVILDLVFNHTGESDAFGPTLSLRGLDARAYFRMGPQGQLINDTGCGNTLACDHPAMRRLVLDTLRHFVGQAGVDGFRFDLAPILGRSARGFDPKARLLAEIAADPLLADRVLIAEPWDIGPGGYQLGSFPEPFLEWSDTFRDRVRRFWRGDPYMLGPFATALAGSSDTFRPPRTRTVNFVAAHDGFSLADLTAYSRKHNEANGEENRDGHDENLSWNNGVEGSTRDPAILSARARDTRALLATLFASRGTIMLAAGDEFGRGQHGNNNAYAQDNAITWLDWRGRDRTLEAYCIDLARTRRAHPRLGDPLLLTGQAGQAGPEDVPDVAWITPEGAAMTDGDWERAEGRAFAMILGAAGARGGPERLAVIFNRGHDEIAFVLPRRDGFAWDTAPDTAPNVPQVTIAGRAVRFIEESSVPDTARTAPDPGRPGATVS
ncbi:glycogen debranching protein GlgX [Amaricoccus sp. W119]|uniref:glycogen debranching protein GlgX n=1 Tax=Amaricoccus sp. W119 TaxID=3391833 RepID=UPI0039A5DC1D